MKKIRKHFLKSVLCFLAFPSFCLSVSLSFTSSAEFQVKGVRIENGDLDHSSLSFETNVPHKFRAEEAPNKILLHLPRDTSFKTFKGKSFDNPHILGYKVHNNHIEINLKPGTKFSSSELLNTKGQHKFILHFSSKKSPPRLLSFQSGKEVHIQEEDHHAVSVRGTPQEIKEGFQVQAIEIQGNLDETLLSVSMSRAFKLPIKMSPDGLRAIIKAPPSNWKNVKSFGNKGGLVSSLSLDNHLKGAHLIILHMSQPSYINSSTLLPIPRSSGGIFIVSFHPRREIPPRRKEPLSKPHKDALPPIVESIVRVNNSIDYLEPAGAIDRKRELENAKHLPTVSQVAYNAGDLKDTKGLSAQSVFGPYFQEDSKKTRLKKEKRPTPKPKASPFAYSPAPSIGLYIGNQAGFGFGPYSLNQSFTNTLQSVPDTADMTKLMKNLGINAFIGYGISLGPAYVGAEISIGYYNAKSLLRRPPEGRVDWRDVRSELQGGSMSVIRGGVFVAPQTLLYLKLGHALTKFRHTTSNLHLDSMDYPQNIETYIHGIVFGGGVESALTNTFALRFDIFHLHNQSIKASTPFNPLGQEVIGTEYAKIHTNYTRADLGITYRFTPYSKDLALPNPQTIRTGLYGAAFYEQGFLQHLREDFEGGDSDKIHDSASKFNHGFGYTVGLSTLVGSLFLAVETHYAPFTRYLKQNRSTHDNDNFKNSLRTAWHTTLRPGFFINDNTIFYGKFGHVRSTFRHRPSKSSYQLTNNSTLPLDYNKVVHGLLLGAGSEIFLFGGLSLRLEFLYEHYKSFKETDSSQRTSSEIITPETYSILMGMSLTL